MHLQAIPLILVKRDETPDHRQEILVRLYLCTVFLLDGPNFDVFWISRVGVGGHIVGKLSVPRQ